MRMSDPDFWNSPDTAKAVSQEATKLKEEVQGHDDLVSLQKWSCVVLLENLCSTFFELCYSLHLQSPS